MDTIVCKDEYQDDQQNCNKQDFLEAFAQLRDNPPHVWNKNENSQWAEAPQQHQELCQRIWSDLQNAMLLTGL